MPEYTPAKLRAAREAAGVTLAELAAEVPANLQTIWRCERGLRPSDEMLAKIERTLKRMLAVAERRAAKARAELAA